MTDATCKRIERLKQILAENAPQLDMQQIGPLLHDLAVAAEKDENTRVLSLMEGVTTKSDIQQLERDVRWGKQKLF